MTNNVVNYAIRNELLGHRRTIRGIDAEHMFYDFKRIDSSKCDEGDASSSTLGKCGGSSRRLKLNHLNHANQFQSIFNTPCLTSKLPCILREHEFDLTGSNLNKIFCSQWLDNRFVIMGSKCNKVNNILDFSSS